MEIKFCGSSFAKPVNPYGTLIAVGKPSNRMVLAVALPISVIECKFI